MAEILSSEITEGKVNGDGYFEEWMRSVTAHIQAEYNGGRISGSDYAEVFLGGLTQTLQLAIQFALERQRAGKEADLIDAQISKTAKEELMIDAQINLTEAEISKMAQEELLIIEQKNKVDAETGLINQQKTNLIAEKLNIEADTAIKSQQLTNLIKELDKLTAEISLMSRQELKLVADIANTEADTDIKIQQLLNLAEDLKKTTAEIELIEANAANAVTQNTNLIKQQEKLDAEVTLLTYKGYTEHAQTSSVVNGSTVAGVIEKQLALYEAQKEGFARDAEQKAAKLYADLYSVQRSTDEGLAPVSNADGAAMTSVFGVLKTGIGA